MKKRIARLAGALVVLAAAAAAAGCEGGDGVTTERVRGLLGEKAIAVLSEPDRVEIYRILGQERDDRPKPAAGVKRIDGFAVIAQGRDRKPEWTARFAAVFFDENTYELDSAKGCELDPGVAVVLTRGEDVLEVVLCFSCDEFRMSGVSDFGEDFDSARPVLVALVKEAFPDDPVVQGLKEKS